MAKKTFEIAGLDALAGDMSKLDQVATEGRVMELDPDQITTDYQVRTTFAEIEELSRSINDIGQQTPITVGPKCSDTGKYPLVLGERRWRAVQLLPGKKVRAIIDATVRSPAALIKAQVTENSQRNDLLPHEVGITIQRYKEARFLEGDKLTHAQVAAEWNKPVHYINLHAGMIDLPACILDLITSDITRDSELLFSLRSFHKLEPEACAQFIADSRDQPDLLTRVSARTKAREAKQRAESKASGGAESTQQSNANPAGGLTATSTTEAQQGLADGGSEQAQQGLRAPVDEQLGSPDGSEQEQQGTQSPESKPAPIVTPHPNAKPAQTDRPKGRHTSREIDANRIVIAVNIALDEPTNGLLLVNRVVEGNPGKCVVEVTKAGKAVEMIVDTDAIDIITMAELAPLT